MSDADFEVFRIHGNPTPEEQSAVTEALSEFLARRRPQRQETAVSPGMPRAAWVLAARLAARRGGLVDARGALGAGTWAATTRIPVGGRAFEGLGGRGDAR
ncbi:MAG TPA: hypothetical protein VKX24_11940 [Acidimicrobiia bacterium]|nr:hypothetical protein [Acidimicrobiia bacterium]